MDLYEIEKQANNVKKYSELLVNNYKYIISNLEKIYIIVSKTNSSTSRKLEDLINRYNKMINIVSNSYRSSAEQILKYVEESRRNLERLAFDIKNSANKLNDVLINMG